MDDLIKILQKLMSESPKPKGGIADTPAGVEFIGRKLTKDEIGGNAIIGSKLTDASRFKPFSIGNVGIENRYSLLREYGDDLAKKFEETITFIKNNPDVRFSQVQQDNILYNLGVYRRVVAEKDKIARGLTEQGKNVDDIFNKRVDNLPDEMLTMEQVLEKFQKNVSEMQKKIKETEDIFAPEKVSDERKLRLKRLYDGEGYDRPNSSLYRGYGSFFLPKLHEKGIIKLDDQIYNNLKEGQHHWGGATYYAPDPIRIWRKHFGNEVFEKLDNFNPDSEDILDWIKRNNIEPVQKDGPKNALEYLTSTELQQNLADETSAFGKYKNPDSAGDNAQFYYRDKPSQRMERITYHGENIGALEQALQTIDPDSYKEYFRTKPTYDSKVLPFKELNAKGGRVGFGEGSEGIVEIDFASAEDKAFSDMMEAYRYYLISGGKKSLKDYMRMSTGAGRKGGGREHFRGAEGGRVDYRVGGVSGREYDQGGSKKSTPSSPSFDRPTMADVAGPSERPRSIGPVPPPQVIEDRPIFDIDETGDPALNPDSDNVTGIIDYKPSTEPTFLETAIDKGKDFVTTVYDNPLVRLGLGTFLPTEFQKLQQILALKNLYSRLIGDEYLEKELKKETGIGLYNDGGRVNLQAGSYEPFSEQDLDINPRQTVQVPSRIQSDFDKKTSDAYRIGNFVQTQNLEPSQFGLVQAYAEDPEMFRGFDSNFFSLSRAQGVAPEPFEKQGYSSDIRHGLGTSAGKDAIVDFIGSNTPLSKTGGITDAIGTVGANIASLFEEGKDIFSSAKDYAKRYPGLTGIQDYDFMPDNKYLTQPFEDIAANYVGSQIPFGMNTRQKIAFISNYAKYGNQTLDQIKNLEFKKMQNRIKAAEEKEKIRIETLTKQRAAQERQRQADQARINRAYREETGGQAGSYATGQSGVQSDGSYIDPFDPGGGE